MKRYEADCRCSSSRAKAARYFVIFSKLFTFFALHPLVPSFSNFSLNSTATADPSSNSNSTMEEDRQVARLWRVSKTIRELVRDRGYIITEDEINVSLDSFRSSHGGSGSVDRTQMNFFTTLADNPEEKLFVFFSPEPSVTTKIIRQLVDVLEQKNIRRGIIIWSEKMSPAAKKVSSLIKDENGTGSEEVGT